MTARHDTPRPSLEELLPILRAPETRERLRNRDGMLEAEGGERYLLVDDIPHPPRSRRRRANPCPHARERRPFKAGAVDAFTVA